MIEDPVCKFKFDVNDFKFIKEISESKHGKISLVQNKANGRLFVTKTSLNKSKVLTDSEKQYIWCEIGFLIRVQHPIFLKFHGLSFIDMKHENNMTLLMDYMPNGSLSKIIDEEEQGKTHENYDNTKRQIILVGICCAMMILHRHHILHRDLKPENILLDENYQPRISDVAMTKFFDPRNTMRSDYPSFTYMAPEVIKYNNFNPKSDVYSFGIIMYEVIMGCRCYSKIIGKKDYNPSQLKSKILKGLRPEFNVPIKRGLQHLIERCWSKNPFERPTFSELYNKLSLLAEEFDGQFGEKPNEIECVHRYCLDNVDASKIMNYLTTINDETDEATKLKTEIRRLKMEISTLTETIKDQSQEIENKSKEIDDLKELLKIQNDQMNSKIEIEHNEVKLMREFLLENVRRQFLESRAKSSPFKILTAIDDIFSNQNIIVLFSQFCQEKLCPEYMYYIEDMAAYYNIKDDLKPLLFFDFRDKYFKDGAPYFLNIKTNVVKEMREAKEPNPELLDKALHLVYDVFKTQLIFEFKHSSIYANYLANPKNRKKKALKKNHIDE